MSWNFIDHRRVGGKGSLIFINLFYAYFLISIKLWYLNYKVPRILNIDSKLNFKRPSMYVGKDSFHCFFKTIIIRLKNDEEKTENEIIFF